MGAVGDGTCGMGKRSFRTNQLPHQRHEEAQLLCMIFDK